MKIMPLENLAPYSFNYSTHKSKAVLAGTVVIVVVRVQPSHMGLKYGYM